jgi:hypothetical protein
MRGNLAVVEGRRRGAQILKQVLAEHHAASTLTATELEEALLLICLGAARAGRRGRLAAGRAAAVHHGLDPLGIEPATGRRTLDRARIEL